MPFDYSLIANAQEMGLLVAILDRHHEFDLNSAKEIARIRKHYRQESVAVTIGETVFI